MTIHCIQIKVIISIKSIKHEPNIACGRCVETNQ